MKNIDSYNTKSTLKISNTPYTFFSLNKLAENFPEIKKLPKSMKILLENILRHEDGKAVTKSHIDSLVSWAKKRKGRDEILYSPARVLMQDMTGVPAIADMAAMRDALKKQKKDPNLINPIKPVDLVIDHSVMVDSFGTKESYKINTELDFKRNGERYKFLHWGQKSFKNFKVVPPGVGICHQVNLEYLGKVVWVDDNNVLYPDTLVGMDSHTPMINGLSVLGWGVGGIEAEAVMLGQPISMILPDVIGFKLTGQLKEGVTATDLVLTICKMLRDKGVVGKFIEFYGDGLSELSLADRATIGNMSPEFGTTVSFFPTDQETLDYLSLTGRSKDHITIVENYAKEQGLWRNDGDEDPVFTESIELDISSITPCISGPKRPHDRISLEKAGQSFVERNNQQNLDIEFKVEGKDYAIKNGSVTIAAITSCTNTSNPSVMLGAGLVAKKANEKGLKVKPWVKTSLAPGSKVVSDYLNQSGLQKDLDDLGFNTVAYGCTTCIGNSGPLVKEISDCIKENDLTVTSVLSGNRNFEGRINPDIKENFLGSPLLVVAYALAGTMNINLQKDPLGQDQDGKDVFLKDIWPTSQEIKEVVKDSVKPEMYKKRYDNVFKGTTDWESYEDKSTDIYPWSSDSTYIKCPPYFEKFKKELIPLQDIKEARPLAIYNDTITTDHISPAGAITPDSHAGKYLQEQGVSPSDFNSFGSRRGNHEVMLRGGFANIRIQNQMVPQKSGGYTKFMPSCKEMFMLDAAEKYAEKNTPLLIFAGKEYGTGSSRDWAAKATLLLGVKAVIAESFERIHRTNLIGMGILPLEFEGGITCESLGLEGNEKFDILGIEDESFIQKCELKLCIKRASGSKETVMLKSRIDTEVEMDYYKNGGILPYVLRGYL
jgi:aconitate hydratase